MNYEIKQGDRIRLFEEIDLVERRPIFKSYIFQKLCKDPTWSKISNDHTKKRTLTSMIYSVEDNASIKNNKGDIFKNGEEVYYIDPDYSIAFIAKIYAICLYGEMLLVKVGDNYEFNVRISNIKKLSGLNEQQVLEEKAVSELNASKLQNGILDRRLKEAHKYIQKEMTLDDAFQLKRSIADLASRW